MRIPSEPIDRRGFLVRLASDLKLRAAGESRLLTTTPDPMNRVIKALLFDLDGTLVDSSAVVRKLMETWCLKHGIRLQAVLDVLGGRRTEDTVALVAPHLCAKSEAAMLENLEGTSLKDMSPIDGAGEFLATLDPTCWAVVTSSSVVSAVPKLEACRLPIPRVLITSESVAEGKPHPEPFLKAALTLGFPPGKCLVFEDADIGVRAALAAGCQVVVVGNGCQVDDADIVGRIASFAELSTTAGGDLLINGKVIATLT